MAEYEVDMKVGTKRRVAVRAYTVMRADGLPEEGPEVGDRVQMTNNSGLHGVVTDVYEVMADNGMGFRYGVKWDDGTETYGPPTCGGKPQDGRGHDEVLMQYIPHPQRVIFKCPICGYQWEPPIKREKDGEWDRIDRHTRQPFSIHLAKSSLPRVKVPVPEQPRRKVIKKEKL